MLNENSWWADRAAVSREEDEVIGANELCQSKHELLASMTSSYCFSSTSTAPAFTALVEIHNVSQLASPISLSELALSHSPIPETLQHANDAVWGLRR